MNRLLILFFSFLMLSACLPTDNDSDKNDDDREDDPPSSLVDMAPDHPSIISTTPSNNQTSVSKSTSITVQFSLDITFTNQQVNVELFGVDNSKTNCRIDWEGFKCGELNTQDSFYELFGAVKADPQNGIDEKTGEIVAGSGIVNSSQRLTATLDRELIEGITYIVHIFYDAPNGQESFKSWWVFKT